MTYVVRCNDCGDRTCTLTCTKKPEAGAPQTCQWSGNVGVEVPCQWAARVSPADTKRS